MRTAAKVAGKGLGIAWNGMKTVTNKTGEITSVLLNNANTIPINILMVGGRRCGKTSLLAAIYKESSSYMSKGDLVISTNSIKIQADLDGKIAEFTEFFSKKKQLFTPDANPTNEEKQYTLDAKIKNKNGTLALNFLDVPGEWYNPKTASQERLNEMEKWVETSHVLLIAIDTPHLMEENGEYNDAKNNVQAINWLIKNDIKFQLDKKGNVVNNRMILFVPMKCEKYLKENRMDEVKIKIKEAYKESFDFLGGSNKANCVVAITPVFTLIGAEFAYFGRNNNLEIEKDGGGVPSNPLYRFDPTKTKPEFHDCEQPLLYILMFMLEYAKRIKEMKKKSIFGFIGEIFFKMPGANDFMAQQNFLKSSIKRMGDGYEIIQNPMGI